MLGICRSYFQARVSCSGRIRYQNFTLDFRISIPPSTSLHRNLCPEYDVAVLITGDTDLAPSVRMARKLFSTKHMVIPDPALQKVCTRPPDVHCKLHAMYANIL